MIYDMGDLLDLLLSLFNSIKAVVIDEERKLYQSCIALFTIEMAIVYRDPFAPDYWYLSDAEFFKYSIHACSIIIFNSNWRHTIIFANFSETDERKFWC